MSKASDVEVRQELARGTEELDPLFAFPENIVIQERESFIEIGDIGFVGLQKTRSVGVENVSQAGLSDVPRSWSHSFAKLDVELPMKRANYFSDGKESKYLRVH